MNKRSNKGFTLVELLIAMSIFSIVIGIGYNVLNKMNITMKNQQVTTSEQLNTNLINKYLVKDLEKCKSFISISDNEFKINDGIKDITYKVEFDKGMNNKEYYSVIRKTNDSSMELISNQNRFSDIPFYINKNNDSHIYNISLDGNKNKKYNFDVSSRLIAFEGKQNPEDSFEEHYELNFWINNNKDNPKNVDIGVCHPGAKHEPYEKENKNVSVNNENSYNIKLSTSLNTSGKHDIMSISNGVGGQAGGDDKFQVQNLNNTSDQLVIVVSDGARLNLKLNNSFIVPNVSQNQYTILLDNGVYTYKIPLGTKDLVVEGTIYKGSEDASVKVLYGKSK